MGQSPNRASLPSHEEAHELQVHVNSNVQEGVFLEEGVLVKVGQEAESRDGCQVTRPSLTSLRPVQAAEEQPFPSQGSPAAPPLTSRPRGLPVEGDRQQPDLVVGGQAEEGAPQAGICNTEGLRQQRRCLPAGSGSSRASCAW